MKGLETKSSYTKWMAISPMEMFWIDSLTVLTQRIRVLAPCFLPYFYRRCATGVRDLLPGLDALNDMDDLRFGK